MSRTVAILEANLQAASSVEQKIDALNALAWELRDLDIQRGLGLAQNAFQLAQGAGSQKGIADSLITQSQFFYSDFTSALSNGYEALRIYDQLRDISGQSRALYTLCWAHWFADNFIEAIEFGRQAQKLAQEIKDYTLEADILNNLGLAYKRSGNFELAYTVYRESLTLYRDIGDVMRQAKVLTNMALAYAFAYRFEDGLNCLQQAMALKVDNPLIDGYAFMALGQIQTGMKSFQDALQNLQRALAIAEKHKLEQLSQTTLHSIGQLYLDQQEPELAISHLQKALNQATEIESNLSRFRCHEVLSRIYEELGEFNKALDHFKQFHKIKEILFNDKNIGRLQFLQIHHEAEIARQEIEIHQLRNVELEQEIRQRKRLQEKLYKQATTDELTGISNRRHFMELAQSEVGRAKRQKNALALALIDLDQFKLINDTYGHSAGDHVLVAFTKTCLTNIREIDIFARFGGDEFSLLLPNSNSTQAGNIIERIYKNLANRPEKYRGNKISISISSGITSYSGKNDSLDKLLSRADQALYNSKEAGKNQMSVIA